MYCIIYQEWYGRIEKLEENRRLLVTFYNNWKWNQVVNRYLHTTEFKLMRQGTADLMRIIGNKIFKSES